MTERVALLAQRASDAPWTAEIAGAGTQPWRAAVAAVAGYREVTGWAGQTAIGPEPPATAIHGHGAWRAARDTVSYAERSATVAAAYPSPVELVSRAQRSRTPVEPISAERRTAATTAVVAGRSPRVPDATRTAQVREQAVNHRALNDAVARLTPALRQQAMTRWKKGQEDAKAIGAEHEDAHAHDLSRSRDDGYGRSR